MPAYTFRSVGAIDYDTNVNPLTPGAPAGRVSGDLLLLATHQRVGVQTVSAISGWTQLATFNTDNDSFYLFARIADGSATDVPTVTWTGTTGDCAAWIECYYGDVYTDLATIVAHSAVGSNEANELSVLRLPSLTITTDNCLVVAFTYRRKTTTSDDATTITAAGGLTKTLQHIQAGNSAMMLASGRVQQTTAANYSGADFTRDGTDESQLSAGYVLALKTAAVTAPSFDSGPTLNTQSTSTYTIDYDASANATNIYVAAYNIGATTPTAAQIEAGTGAVATATEATTGSADSIVITIPGGDPAPAHDLYAVLKGAGGYSSIGSLLGRFLTAPAGRQRVTIAVPWTAGTESVLENASPAAVSGDILDTATTTSPGGYTVTADADGVLSYSPNFNTARQTITARFWDKSLAAWSDASPGVTFYINNNAPTYNTIASQELFVFKKNTAITTINLEPRWTDVESDSLTVAFQDTLPSGLSGASEQLSGTPTVYSNPTSYTLRATDVTGDYEEIEFNISVGDEIPNVSNTSVASATSTLTAIASFTIAGQVSQTHASIAAGNVIDTDPSIGTLVPANQAITLIVSSGASNISVPDLVGSTVSSVGSALTSVGLIKGTVTYSVDPANALKVISQSPTAGSSVSAGSAVNYTVGVTGSVVTGHSRGRGRRR